MKVLWFASAPGSGAGVIKSEFLGGGWIKSLDKLVGQKVELHFAFSALRPFKSFSHNGIKYYPIVPKNWFWTKLKDKIALKITDEQELSIYLKIIEEVNPDIIHIHGTENPFGLIIGRTPIPVVVSMQGSSTVCHFKFYSGFDKKSLSIKEWDFSSISNFPFFQSFRKKYLLFRKKRQREIKILKNSKYIIGRTAWDYRVTRILAPLSKYYHGDEVLRDAFYEARWFRPENQKLIIHSTIANLPYKGFETLCQSLYILREIGLDVEWRVAGIRKNDLIVKLTKKFLGNEYPRTGLVLLGGLDEHELVEKLLEAHIFVMTSHIENSPNSLCEAMMLGMPCIATYAGGTGSLLKDGEEGVLIQDGDPWAMAGAVLELARNPELAHHLGERARKRALRRHEKEEITNNLIEIYQKIIYENK